MPAEQQGPRWRPGPTAAVFDPAQLTPYLQRVRDPLHVVTDGSHPVRGVGVGGEITVSADGYPLIGVLPPVRPEWLGDQGFCQEHDVRFPYVAGEMANGIATTRMVSALAQARMLGFFGAAGLDPPAVENAVAELATTLAGRRNWGVNLIHSPGEPALEDQVAEILIKHRVPAVSVSAFIRPTRAVVRCAAAGLTLDRGGRIVRPMRMLAKVSRPEVAEAFLSPPPGDLLAELVSAGRLTPDEARLAARLPLAEDVTVEADSGGHTDNRSLGAMLPAVLAVRNAVVARERYPRQVRVGAAGGLGTPHAVAAAFALGAAYVVTGSVNQLAAESGISDDARMLLAAAAEADVAMAPSADMFELGAKVQVLRRGTMFAARATRLYETYRAHPSLAAVPADLRAALEADVLHATFDEVWARTRDFWDSRDPAQTARAERDPKHRMALVFRWYLGRASRWAIEGESSRRTDYQLWAGPAVGAFNRWTRGSFLADPHERTVAQIGLNLMEGAAVVTRAHQARTYGLPVPAEAFGFAPRPLASSAAAP
jgi:trans-AT polyketide synthase, acyltransferase and oxidoreductase domains